MLIDIAGIIILVIWYCNVWHLIHALLLSLEIQNTLLAFCRTYVWNQTTNNHFESTCVNVNLYKKYLLSPLQWFLLTFTSLISYKIMPNANWYLVIVGLHDVCFTIQFWARMFFVFLYFQIALISCFQLETCTYTNCLAEVEMPPDFGTWC